ncbi:hypothetical protein F5B19DRAFT_415794 [Rostrohypoxylon terebratum]|nr:hypothetical protein F5B19DRAFT_415794 [Rostrohypoxylon terebratum]
MALGICEFGFQWYSCDNGFKGCCRINACGPDQCPEGERTTTSYSVAYIDSASTTSSPTSTNTDDTPPVPTSTTDTDGDSTSPSTTPSTSSQSSASSSSSQSSTPTTSTPSPQMSSQTAPSTIWVPVPTNPAQNEPAPSVDEHPRLSTTAIAGISVGSTVAVALLGLITYLLVRRLFIQRRNNRASGTNPFAFASTSHDAAGFMADHPSWRGGEDVGKTGGGEGKRATGEVVEADDGTPGKPPGLKGLYELP